MNVIEVALNAYLAANEDSLAVQLRALPLYRGWTGTVYLTTTGEFLFRDEEVEPAEIRPENDEHMQLAALAEGAARFSILANLLQPRPTTNHTCDLCGGSGHFTPQNATGWLYCPHCHGVGWRGKLELPLSLSEMNSHGVGYPAFEEAAERFQAYLREQGMVGVARFVPHSDITVVGPRVYVRHRDVMEGLRRATREYHRAVRRRLGVLLSVACIITDTKELVCYVYGPTDNEESIRLTNPDGVKYTVTPDLRQGAEVSRVFATLLRFLSRYIPSIHEMQGRLK